MTEAPGAAAECGCHPALPRTRACRSSAGEIVEWGAESEPCQPSFHQLRTTDVLCDVHGVTLVQCKLRRLQESLGTKDVQISALELAAKIDGITMADEKHILRQENHALRAERDTLRDMVLGYEHRDGAHRGAMDRESSLCRHCREEWRAEDEAGIERLEVGR